MFFRFPNFRELFMRKNHFGNEQASDRENRPVASRRDARVEPAHDTSGSTCESRFNAAGDFCGCSLVRFPWSSSIPERKERLLVD